jgi:NAD dependent epimerase/dehydratase family enzyme
MKTEPSLALTGRRCAPKRFLESGFQFKFTELSAALKDIYP